MFKKIKSCCAFSLYICKERKIFILKDNVFIKTFSFFLKRKGPNCFLPDSNMYVHVQVHVYMFAYPYTFSLYAQKMHIFTYAEN